MSDRHDEDTFFQELGEAFGATHHQIPHATPKLGPGQSKLCPPNHFWDPIVKACVKEGQGYLQQLGAPQNFRTVVPVIYRARPGETLAQIANRFRVSAARHGELLLANPGIPKIRLASGAWAFAYPMRGNEPIRIPKTWLVVTPIRGACPRGYKRHGSYCVYAGNGFLAEPRAQQLGAPAFLGQSIGDSCSSDSDCDSGNCIFGYCAPGTGGTTTPTCGANQIDDGNGGCTCEAGYQDDGSGGCVPIAQTGGQALVCAGGGGTWNNDTAFCECPSGTAWNPDTSSCDQPTDASSACSAAGGVWNGQWCECNPGHRYVNGACVPVSQSDCTAGQTYDESGPQGPNCYWCGQNTPGDDGTHWDTSSHSCQCASGQTWNDAQKKCIGSGGGAIVQPPPNPNPPNVTPPPTPATGTSYASIGLWVAVLVALGYGAYEITKMLAEKGHKGSALHLPKALTRRARTHRRR